MPTNDETGTITCRHVAEGGEAVTFVFRDTDGSWQHLCERDHTSDASEFVIVGLPHFEARQPELRSLRVLKPGWIAQRAGSGAWTEHANAPN